MTPTSPAPAPSDPPAGNIRLPAAADLKPSEVLTTVYTRVTRVGPPPSSAGGRHRRGLSAGSGGGRQGTGEL